MKSQPRRTCKTWLAGGIFLSLGILFTGVSIGGDLASSSLLSDQGRRSGPTLAELTELRRVAFWREQNNKTLRHRAAVHRHLDPHVLINPQRFPKFNDEGHTTGDARVDKILPMRSYFRQSLPVKVVNVQLYPRPILYSQQVLPVPQVPWNPNLYAPHNTPECMAKYGKLSQQSTEMGAKDLQLGKSGVTPFFMKCVGTFSGETVVHEVDHWNLRAELSLASHPMGNIVHGGVNPPRLMAQAFALADAGGIGHLVRAALNDSTKSSDDDVTSPLELTKMTTIVELGCGNGNMLFAICPPHPFIRCYGTDYAEKMMQYAQAYFGDWMDIRHGIGAGHIPSGSANLVLSNGVAFYLTAQQLCTHIAEGMRLLVPGGKMVIAGLFDGKFGTRTTGTFFAMPEEEPVTSPITPTTTSDKDGEEEGEGGTTEKSSRRTFVPYCGAELGSLIAAVKNDYSTFTPLYHKKSRTQNKIGNYFVAIMTRSNVAFCDLEFPEKEKNVAQQTASASSAVGATSPALRTTDLLAVPVHPMLASPSHATTASPKAETVAGSRAADVDQYAVKVPALAIGGKEGEVVHPNGKQHADNARRMEVQNEEEIKPALAAADTQGTFSQADSDSKKLVWYEKEVKRLRSLLEDRNPITAAADTDPGGNTGAQDETAAPVVGGEGGKKNTVFRSRLVKSPELCPSEADLRSFAKQHPMEAVARALALAKRHQQQAHTTTGNNSSSTTGSSRSDSELQLTTQAMSGKMSRFFLDLYDWYAHSRYRRRDKNNNYYWHVMPPRRRKHTLED